MADPKPNTTVIKAASTELTSDQAYTALLDRFVALYRTGQARAIQVMHKMGAHIDEFMREQEEGGAKRYGSRNLDKLIDDLNNRGVQQYARSTLYHCRKVFLIMKEADIDLLANRGYSVNHVKALLPLSDELREKIQSEMVDLKTQSVIPLPVLELKIRDAQMEVKRADADAATDPADVVRAAAAEGPANGVTSEDAAAENGYTGEDGELRAGEGGKGGPAGASTTGKDYSAPPLAAVKAMGKICDQFVTLVPGVTKSCREVTKIGFDSPKAAENWCMARDTCMDALKGVQQYVDGLLETLAAEKRDGGADSFKDSAPKPKGKKGKRR
jgi:hypothetical protein